jgi:hypothetical protein
MLTGAGCTTHLFGEEGILDVAAQDKAGEYPPELLWGVSWTFRGEPFADRSDFDAAVAEYQDPDRGEVWRPEEVVLYAGRVRVSPDVAWYLTEEHPTVEFIAGNGESFTSGELLFKVHNRFVAELRQMDHKYFEGFTLDEDDDAGESPLYGLDLGS